MNVQEKLITLNLRKGSHIRGTRITALFKLLGDFEYKENFDYLTCTVICLKGRKGNKVKKNEIIKKFMLNNAGVSYFTIEKE